MTTHSSQDNGNPLEQLIDNYIPNEGLRNVVKYAVVPAVLYYGIEFAANMTSLITGNHEFAEYGQILAPAVAGYLMFTGTQRMPRNQLRRALQLVIGGWIGYDIASYLSNYSGTINLLENIKDMVNYVDMYTTRVLGRSAPGAAGALIGAVATAKLSKG
ncbi:MAG: hypothetical protein NDI94_06300 [Candidatus Woesearchaeota archaeon]|nr:hypothetical protein [Candidatus Woesearchaeota archaeon]